MGQINPIPIPPAGYPEAGDSPMARRVLRTTLLTAQGAELALGPLTALDALVAAARLSFRRRKPLGQDRTPAFPRTLN
jgi:hypothetical protein